MKALIKIFLIVFLPSEVLAGETEYGNISITIPDGWVINSSIIENEKGEKVGEFMPKSAFEIKTRVESGTDFIQAIKNGLEIESDFIESGSTENIYWACTSVEAYGDIDGPIIWFPRSFWNNGSIVVLYSRVSCKDNFEQAMQIAKSMRAK
jgi:hypothetical protein